MNPVPDARLTLAKALAEAANGEDLWDRMSEFGRTRWLHEADRVMNRLRRREFMVCLVSEA